MKRDNNKNLKAVIITLIIISLMSVLSPEQNSVISSGLNALTRGLFQLSAAATASADEADAEALRKENERLKRENASLKEQLADYIDSKNENARLKIFFEITEKNPTYKLLPANVIKRDANDDFYSFTLDRGTSEGVKVNDAVVSENGLVGWVCQADALTCKVKTILSPDTRAAAEDKQSGNGGIISGSAALCGRGLTSLGKLEENNTVKKGDMVVTSGEGGVYPKGLLVGEVVKVEVNSYDASRYAEIKPYENIARVKAAAVITEFTAGEAADNEK